MEEEKSYVGMQMCPICKKEATGILMDRRLKASLPRQSLGVEPCDKCRKKYLKNGILMINPYTGSLVVIRESAFKRIFKNTPVPPKRIAFAQEEVLQRLRGGSK
jgi:hypothetical protein